MPGFEEYIRNVTEILETINSTSGFLSLRVEPPPCPTWGVMLRKGCCFQNAKSVHSFLIWLLC